MATDQNSPDTNPTTLQPSEDMTEPDERSPSEPIEPRPGYLLALPAELRLRIYEEVLSPTGALTLHQTPTHRHAVFPTLRAASFLSTCRQIYTEAHSILYTDNEVCVRVNAHDTTWPSLPQARLPQSALEALQHLCVVFDCVPFFRADYDDVDFAPFEALVALRTLRVAVVFDRRLAARGGFLPGTQDEDQERSRLEGLLLEILMRVPATTNVLCEIKGGSQQQALVDRVLGVGTPKERFTDTALQATAAEVQEAVELVPVELRGVKSGRNANVYTGNLL